MIELVKLKRYGILISYLIGLPIGLLTIMVVFLMPAALSGEGLVTMGFMVIYGNAIVGLTVSFLFSLWFAGKNIAKDFVNKIGLVRVSFKYSLKVNLIIWLVFICVTIFDHLPEIKLGYLIMPITLLVACVIATTFSIGLLICYIVQIKVLEKLEL